MQFNWEDKPQRLNNLHRGQEYNNLNYYTKEELDFIMNNKELFIRENFLIVGDDILDLVFDETTINKPMEFTPRSPDGYVTSTPLVAAILQERVDLINYLISHGADVNLISRYFSEEDDDEIIYVPILVAIATGNIEILKILLDSGVFIDNSEIDSEYNDEYTNYPLTYALLLGNFEIAYLLVGYGADLNYVDERGYDYRSPAMGLIEYYDNIIRPPLIKLTGQIITRTKKEALFEIEQIFHNGLNLSDSNVPLIRHILGKSIFIRDQNNWIDLLKLFLKYGADPNITNDNYFYISSTITILLIIYGYKFNDTEIKNIVSSARNDGTMSIVDYFTNHCNLNFNRQKEQCQYLTNIFQSKIL